MQTSLDQVLFAHVLGRDESELDLAVAALLVAQLEYPDLEIEEWTARLDELAADCQAHLASDASPSRRAHVVADRLFNHFGFSGNSSDYYDPRNSFLNEVLERRLGIPITLALLFIEVARRVGIAAHGLNFPGHFLVRVDVDDDGFFVLDPFYGGLRVSIDEMRKRIKGVLGPDAVLEARFLVAAGKREMIVRLLNNLAAIYRRAQDTERSLAVLERMAILQPDNIRVANELAILRKRRTDRN